MKNHEPNTPDNQNTLQEQNENPTEIRRRFLKQFGKYAVSTPVVTFTLMSTMTSKAIASGNSDTVGDGDEMINDPL